LREGTIAVGVHRQGWNRQIRASIGDVGVTQDFGEDSSVCRTSQGLQILLSRANVIQSTLEKALEGDGIGRFGWMNGAAGEMGGSFVQIHLFHMCMGSLGNDDTRSRGEYVIWCVREVVIV
jgi:hypothetical protein